MAQAEIYGKFGFFVHSRSDIFLLLFFNFLHFLYFLLVCKVYNLCLLWANIFYIQINQNLFCTYIQ